MIEKRHTAPVGRDVLENWRPFLPESATIMAKRVNSTASVENDLGQAPHPRLVLEGNSSCSEKERALLKKMLAAIGVDESDAAWGSGEWGEGLPVLRIGVDIPTLSEMLANPALKRKAWTHLKKLKGELTE